MDEWEQHKQTLETVVGSGDVPRAVEDAIVAALKRLRALEDRVEDARQSAMDRDLIT